MSSVHEIKQKHVPFILYLRKMNNACYQTEQLAMCEMADLSKRKKEIEIDGLDTCANPRLTAHPTGKGESDVTGNGSARQPYLALLGLVTN